MKLIVLEIVVGFGIPVSWAVWELVKLRREQRRDREKAAALEQLAPPPPSGEPPIKGSG
jgi:hypothetical protein